MNAVDVVHEIVEITVDSGAAKGVWPIRTRFEVGRDRKTGYERLKGKSPKVQGMSFAERILWKRKRAEGPLGKLPCMCEDGIYLVSKEPRGSASWRIGVACGSRGLFEGS